MVNLALKFLQLHPLALSVHWRESRVVQIFLELLSLSVVFPHIIIVLLVNLLRSQVLLLGGSNCEPCCSRDMLRFRDASRASFSKLSFPTTGLRSDRNRRILVLIMIGWPLKVLLIFELILIFYIVPLIEILRLILCIFLLKLFILIVNLIIFRHFNAQVSILITLFLVSLSLLIIVHSLSIISLKVLNLVALIIELLKVLVISLIYFQILRSILPRLMLTLIELSLLLSAFILIIVLTRRIILILFKRRWRLRVLWKRNSIFNARSWRIHYAIKLLVKLLLLKIHCMEDLLGSLMLVIIHVDRIMMSAMVDLKKMRLRRIGYQHTSVQLSSFVQVLPHLPGLILKSFNFVQKRQIAHLKQLSLLRILNTGI